MHLYEEQAGPSTVTHSLVCNLAPNHENLIVVRGGTLLQVYSIVHAPEGYEIPRQTLNLVEPESLLEYTDGASRKFLVLEHEFPMDGTLVGLGLRGGEESLPQGHPSQLVLAFAYAKIVLLEWTGTSFKPVSLHFYEKQILESNFRDLNFPTKLLLETHGQCLSLWYQKDQFAILSFPSEELEKLGPTGSILLTSRHLEPRCANIVDMAYLKGYNEPTLGVLYQRELTWTGDLIKHKDTVQFKIISVDVEQQNSTVIFAQEGLPYDLEQILSLDAPIGGTLLFGSNFFTFVEANGRSVNYAVNQFAERTSDATSIDYSGLGLDLAGCKAAQVPGSSHVLVVTAQGEVLDLSFKVDGFRVFGITIVHVRSAPPIYNPSSIVCGRDTVFISSFTGCSLLLNFELVESKTSLYMDEDEEFEGVYDAAQSSTGLRLTLSDALLSLGPITSVAAAHNPSQVCVAFGREKSGGVAKLQKGLWPNGTYQTGKFSRMWTTERYVVGTSHKQSKSWVLKYPNFEPVAAPALANKVTVAFSQVPHSDTFWHIFATGMAVYNAKFEVLWSIETAELRSACISGNMALVCGVDHTLNLWQLQGSEAAFLEHVATSNRYHLFEEHIVYCKGASVHVCSVHDPSSPQRYDLSGLPQDASKPVQEPSTITEIVIGRIGDDFGSSVVLGVVSRDVLALYDLHRMHKLYTAPCTADLGLYTIKVGTLEGFAAGGRTPFVLLKGHKSPVQLRPLRCARALCVRSIGSSLLFIDSRKDLRVVHFDSSWDYTSYGWPCSTLYIGESIQSISWNEANEVLAVGTNKEIRREDIKDKMEDETELEAGLAEPAEPALPTCPIFSSFIHLVDLHRMQVLDTAELGSETLVCLQSVRLEVADNTDHFKEFIAAGTSIMLDEDSVANGHFLLFSINELVGDGGYKLKQTFKELCAGPVTALTEVMGKLAAAQGSRLLMRGVQEDHSIEPIAFTDLEVYTSELKSVRNIVVCADACKSTSLVNFGLEPKRLDVLARDPDTMGGAVSAEALSSELREDLHVVACDCQGRLKVVQFDPDNVASMGGPRLVPQSHFNIGAKVGAMASCYGRGEDLAALMGTEFGGLSLMVPLAEKDYRGLFVVSEQLVDKPVFACLNPRAFLGAGCGPSETSVIYGPVVRRLWALDLQQQLSSLGRNGLADILSVMSEDCVDYF